MQLDEAYTTVFGEEKGNVNVYSFFFRVINKVCIK